MQKQYDNYNAIAELKQKELEKSLDKLDFAREGLKKFLPAVTFTSFESCLIYLLLQAPQFYENPNDLFLKREFEGPVDYFSKASFDFADAILQQQAADMNEEPDVRLNVVQKIPSFDESMETLAALAFFGNEPSISEYKYAFVPPLVLWLMINYWSADKNDESERVWNEYLEWQALNPVTVHADQIFEEEREGNNVLFEVEDYVAEEDLPPIEEDEILEDDE